MNQYGCCFHKMITSTNSDLPAFHVFLKLTDIGLFQILSRYSIAKQHVIVVHKNIYQFFNEMLSQFRVLAGFLTAMLFYNINYFAYFSDHP